MDSIETMQRVIDESKRIVNNVAPEQLGNKTTCTDWTVRDLINHITGGATMVGMSIEKEKSDLFRHKILGLGSGDLVVRTSGADRHEFHLTNVLFVSRKLQQIEDMQRTRQERQV